MRNTAIIFAACLSLAACNKTAKADQLNTEGQTQAPAVAIQSQEDLLKTAKSKPITTVAISQNHHDFGKITKGDKVQHTYEFTNTGKNPLIISAVKPGCGCTAPDYTKEPVMPGEKGEVTLSFDSANFDGLVNKEASVYANVDKAPIVLTFSADIQR